MPTPIFERLNGARSEADPKRSAARVPAERAKEQAPASRRAQLNRTDFGALKSRIQRRIIAELAPEADLGGVPGRRAIEELFNDTLAEEGIPLPRLERTRLLEAIMAELLSFGPIEPLLRDESISARSWSTARTRSGSSATGKLEETDVKFENDDHVRRIIDRIVAPLGRRCDEASPDGGRPPARRLPRERDHPAALAGRPGRSPSESSRATPLTMQRPGPVRHRSRRTWRTSSAACVQARLNVLVSGGTGSGKTTLLNVLSSFIPSDERIVTIEDAAELQLRQQHVISLEKRPAEHRGHGRDRRSASWCVNSLRMRPDRIVVGECPRRRGAGHAPGDEHGPRRLA